VGTAVGWGFQFQQPWFLVGLTLLFTAFATNLFGAWQLTLRTDGLGALHARSQGPSRSVLEGVLAVLVATPCTAPLLGVAVGVGLAAPAPLLVAVCVAIGVGLAAPYVVLTLVPAAQRLVPPPGAWMNHLKHALGFALLGTAAWLLGVVASAYGASAAMGLLWLSVALGFCTWIWGLLQARSTLASVGGVAIVLACIALGWPNTATWTPERDAVAEAPSDGASDWQPWSEAAVAAARAEGRPVFVDFTADWCISCKVNERRVLAREDVREAFAARNTALLLADWTHRDETIRATLTSHGRAGVPLYLWYWPDSDVPEVLPEILTRDGVLAVLERTVPLAPSTEVP
jgi:thiol:disulfide interchange protein DsbD